jgi:hypothetical protein
MFYFMKMWVRGSEREGEAIVRDSEREGEATCNKDNREGEVTCDKEDNEVMHRQLKNFCSR